MCYAFTDTTSGWGKKYTDGHSQRMRCFKNIYENKQRILPTLWCKVSSVSKGNAVLDHIANVSFPNITTDFSKPGDKTDNKIYHKQ